MVDLDGLEETRRRDERRRREKMKDEKGERREKKRRRRKMEDRRKREDGDRYEDAVVDHWTAVNSVQKGNGSIKSSRVVGILEKRGRIFASDQIRGSSIGWILERNNHRLVKIIRKIKEKIK